MNLLGPRAGDGCVHMACTVPKDGHIRIAVAEFGESPQTLLSNILCLSSLLAISTMLLKPSSALYR